MENEQVLSFLKNLVDRIELDTKSGKLKLDGVISEMEYQSLAAAVVALGGGVAPAPMKTSVTDIVPPTTLAVESVALNLDSLEFEGPEDSEILLCLDFGTAMSKAFATDGSDDNLVDLEIGRQAGQTDPIYALVSSVFITNNHRMLFGHRAVAESTHADGDNRRRFDSIKDILCKDVVCDLDEAPLEQSYNPTSVHLTKGDMVTLFLGYFTDMAASQLQDKGHSRYVRRRFTRPVLPPDRAPWAEDQLRILLARAQILADTLHGQWEDGIDVGKAKRILDEIRNLEEIPSFLIDEGIVEPVAAVGSRYRNLVCKNNLRRLLLVVDVGAGTIDFALFAELHEKGKGLKVFQIPGTVQVLRQAGDAVDKLLRRYILKKSDVTSTDADFHMIDADLSLRIRQMKEQLFRDKKIEYVLTNDRMGSVTLSEFLDQPGVHEFEKSIREKFMLSLNDAHESWVNGLGSGGLAVVFTGGGASLPMVQNVASNNVVAHGRKLMLSKSTPIPQWVLDDYPEMQVEFPQLAVAIGGSSRNLPLLAPQTFEEFGGLEATGWTIQPAYKGS